MHVRREHDIYLAEPGKPEIKLGAGQDVALAFNDQGLFAVWTAEGAIQSSKSGIARVLPHVSVVSVTTSPRGATIFVDRRDLGLG